MSEVADKQVNEVPEEDWATLFRALVERFPQVAAGEVVENLTRNRGAVEDFGVAEAEQRETVELMTRYQLMQLTGEAPDNARYEPEQHIPRIREPGDSLGDS